MKGLVPLEIPPPRMPKNLVIVESPAKAKTLKKFLGKDYEVEASIGHVRDLPTSMADIPESWKGNPRARLGVDVEHDFEPLYVVPVAKREQIKNLKRLLKGASVLWLATDEDREGESISWHLVEVLQPKVPVKRLVFHEITKEAILDSLEHPRDIDQNLVKAQETRRILDRLFGYEVSPVLWRKIRGGLSAGRVQSVALRLLVDREQERMKFRSSTWWDLTASLAAQTPAPSPFDATLVEVAGRRVAIGKDFDSVTGALSAKDADILDETKARALEKRLRGRPGRVLDVEEKPFTQRPSAPFTTSTLQQEAGRKLRYGSDRTMRLAQRLYENGAITYMRTDSTVLSQQAIQAARSLIAEQYGDEHLPPTPRLYQTKVKNAQEAHEAVRPAGSSFRSIDDVRAEFGHEAGALYELIWKRTVASQMKDAVGRRVTARIGIEEAVFRASGSTLTFAGFQRAYVEGSDDPEGDLADRDTTLPPLAAGQTLSCRSLESKGHETQPPARYTEASLVKELDTRGIGRPSTWAGIITVLLNREYAFRKGNTLVPTFTAFVVVRMLKSCFGEVLEYEFTAKMEDELDAISRGEYDSREYLRRFYMGNGRPGLEALIKTGLDTVDPRKACSIPLGTLDGRDIEIRVGKYGLFLSDGEGRASLPEDTVPDELKIERARDLLAAAALGPTPLGDDPATGQPVFVKSGRFGPYVQLGAGGEGAAKPKMVSLLKGMEPAAVDLATALRLLTLPRDLGAHPEDAEKKPVQALLGRYGPYVKWGDESRSIPADVSVLDVTLDQAVAFLKQPRSRRGRAPAAAPLRELGPHPATGKVLKVLNGRYGPYVSDGTLNASLPKGTEPEALTVEEAVGLLERRAERVKEGGGRFRPRRGVRKAAPAPSDGAPKPLKKPAKKPPPRATSPGAKRARAKPAPRKPAP